MKLTVAMVTTALKMPIFLHFVKKLHGYAISQSMRTLFTCLTRLAVKFAMHSQFRIGGFCRCNINYFPKQTKIAVFAWLCPVMGFKILRTGSPLNCTYY